MEQITELAGPVLQFKTRAEKVGAKVLVAVNLAEAVALIAQTIAEGETGPIVVPSSLLTQEPIFKSTFQENLQEATSTAVITGAVAGISPGEFGICETGSVVYAVNDPLERQVAMLSVVHFALLYADRLIPDLDTAGARLKELQTREGRRYVSFVTGPSRTADIERVLTIGVQGPKALYVVLINQRD
jgi:L-lactate dehydrogenase complex protein LldG